MNRKYINYAIFIAIVAVVVGLAVNHSARMRGLVGDMAGADQDKRVAAAQTLVTGEQFMDAVTGETIQKRTLVVLALEDWGGKEATKQLIAYVKDPDKPVRDRILMALLRLGAKTEDNLQEVVTGIKDGDGNVRKACVKTLQILGQTDSAAVKALVPPDISKDEAVAAWQKRDVAVAAKIVSKVVELMKKEDPARGPGGDVLGALPAADREKAVAALLPLLKEQVGEEKHDEPLRKGAADALGKIGLESAVPALKEAMKSDTAPVRRIAIGAIALIADISGEASLIEAIQNRDDDNEARAQAAAGLGRIGTPTAVATLLKALNDYDLKLQVAAVAALARVGDSAIGPLLNTLRVAEPMVRVRAADALSRIASPKANAGLIAALKDASPNVREAAAKALGFKDNAAAVAALTPLLNDRDGAVAAAAAEALTRIGESARSALASALSGSDIVAYQAARALGKQGEQAAAAVEQGIAQSPRAQRWAVVAFASMGGQRAVAALKNIAESGDAETKEAASQALKQLGAQ